MGVGGAAAQVPAVLRAHPGDVSVGARTTGGSDPVWLCHGAVAVSCFQHDLLPPWPVQCTLPLSYPSYLPFCRYQPYHSNKLNRVEQLSLVTAVITLLLPNIMERTATGALSRDLSLGLLLFFNCVIIAYFICTLVHARFVSYGWFPHHATSAVADARAAGPAPPAVPDDGGESGRLREDRSEDGEALEEQQQQQRQAREGDVEQKTVAEQSRPVGRLSQPAAADAHQQPGGGSSGDGAELAVKAADTQRLIQQLRDELGVSEQRREALVAAAVEILQSIHKKATKDHAEARRERQTELLAHAEEGIDEAGGESESKGHSKSHGKGHGKGHSKVLGHGHGHGHVRRRRLRKGRTKKRKKKEAHGE